MFDFFINMLYHCEEGVSRSSWENTGCKIEANIGSPLFHRHQQAGRKKWSFKSPIATHIYPDCNFNHLYQTHSHQIAVN